MDKPKLTRINWDYTSTTEVDKYIKKYLYLYNQLMADLNKYYLEKAKPYTETEFRKDVKEFKKQDYRIFLYADENNNIVAMSELHPSAGVDGSAWIDALVVDKNARGGGYGTFILQDMLSYIKQSGFKYVSLAVAEGNTAARSLYEKNKLKTIERTLVRGLESFSKDNPNKLLYVKELQHTNKGRNMSNKDIGERINRFVHAVDTHTGYEGIISSIIDKIRGVPSPNECKEFLQFAVSATNKLKSKYSDLKVELDELTKKDIERFCNQNKSVTTSSAHIGSIAHTSTDRNEIVKCHKRANQFLNELVTMCAKYKKFGLYPYVYTSVWDGDEYYYSLSFSAIKTHECSPYKPKELALNLTTADELKARRMAIDLLIKVIRQVVNKYPIFKDRITLGSEDDAYDVGDFLSGSNTAACVGTCDVSWDYDSGDFDDAKYKELVEEAEKFAEDVIVTFMQAIGKNNFIVKLEWDDEYCFFSVLSGTKVGKEAFETGEFPRILKYKESPIYGMEGIVPHHLDRNFLESDDPGMKRKVMNEIGILTRKMKEMAPHFYLDPQIDDELVYEYLRNCPKELALMNKWIRFPNIELNDALAKCADKLAKYTQFDPGSVTLYRAFKHPKSLSAKKTKWPQQMLGLQAEPGPGSIPKKAGSQFSYPITRPYSFTRSQHFSDKFGDICISAPLKNFKGKKFIDCNDSLVAAVFLNIGSVRINVAGFKIYDHIRFLREVVIIANNDLTPVKFHLVKTPGPLYFTPYSNDGENKSPELSGGKKQGISLLNLTKDDAEKDMEAGEKSKIKGEESLSMFIEPADGTEGLPFYMGLSTTGELSSEYLEVAEESLLSNLIGGDETATSTGKSFTEHAKKYLDLFESIGANNKDVLQVFKTNLVNGCYPERISRLCPVLIQALNLLPQAVQGVRPDVHKLDEVLDNIKKICGNMGFTTVANTRYDLKKEVGYKTTQGNVNELGYRYDNIVRILKAIIDHPIEDIDAATGKLVELKTKMKKSGLEDPQDISAYKELIILLKGISDANHVLVTFYKTMGRIMKATYKPLVHYMKLKNQNNAETQK